MSWRLQDRLCIPWLQAQFSWAGPVFPFSPLAGNTQGPPQKLNSQLWHQKIIAATMLTMCRAECGNNFDGFGYEILNFEGYAVAADKTSDLLGEIWIPLRIP